MNKSKRNKNDKKQESEESISITTIPTMNKNKSETQVQEEEEEEEPTRAATATQQKKPVLLYWFVLYVVYYGHHQEATKEENRSSSGGCACCAFCRVGAPPLTLNPLHLHSNDQEKSWKTETKPSHKTMKTWEYCTLYTLYFMIYVYPRNQITAMEDIVSWLVLASEGTSVKMPRDVSSK